MFSLVCTTHALVLLLCACATYRARAGSQQRGAVSVGDMQSSLLRFVQRQEKKGASNVSSRLNILPCFVA